MKLFRIVSISLLTLLLVSSAAFAGDFGWTKDYNIQAQADPSGIRARLATRFNIGAAKVTAVLSNFDTPADAYIALRLGEMSGRSIDDVIGKYKQNKGQGWGALAKSLGIKPGSEEFHALKQDHDLYGGNAHGYASDGEHGKASGSEHGKASGSNNGHSKNKGHGKGKK